MQFVLNQDNSYWYAGSFSIGWFHEASGVDGRQEWRLLSRWYKPVNESGKHETWKQRLPLWQKQPLLLIISALRGYREALVSGGFAPTAQ
jgi:hypothetical protein